MRWVECIREVPNAGISLRLGPGSSLDGGEGLFADAFLVGDRPNPIGVHLVDDEADGLAKHVACRKAVAVRMQIPSAVVPPVFQTMRQVVSLVATISAVPQ